MMTEFLLLCLYKTIIVCGL